MVRFRGLLAGGALVVAASLLVAQEKADPNIQSKGGKVKPGQTTQSESENANQNQKGQNQKGQARQGQGQRNQAQRGGAQSAAVDQYVLACVIAKNEGEIAISKIGEQRASSPEVKEFAARMVKEHTAFLEKLRTAQGDERNAGQARDGQSNTQAQSDRREIQRSKRDSARPNTTGEVGESAQKTADVAGDSERQGATGTQDNAHGGQGAIPVQTLISVNKEIHDKIQAALQQELEQKEGAEFDKKFMSAQCNAHVEMANSLEVLQNHVSQDLQQTLSEGAQTAQQHLDHAKTVSMKLEGDAGAQTAQQREKTGSTQKEQQKK